MRKPALIDYGIVYDAHYLLDTGCVEARVRLHMQDSKAGEKDVELVTSVMPHPSDTESSLRTRLVISAARLLRRIEASAVHRSPKPAAAHVA